MAVFLLFDGKEKAATLLKFILTVSPKYNNYIKNAHVAKY
jgi:hypothetical protein